MLFSKSTVQPCPVLVLSPFLSRIPIRVGPVSHMAILLKEEQITFRLCLLANIRGFWKRSSTRGTKVQTSGEVADKSVGKEHREPDSVLIRALLDFVRKEAIE